MKVIFLDFNGVLDKHDNMNVINIDNLMRLKNIVDETNAKIVISSSIRISYYYSGKISNLLKYVMDEITSCGMDIIGFTP